MCWTCNLFPLQWQDSPNQFTHVTWRYMGFSAVSGTESTSAYCSTKKTCICIHASRSWHFCRALLGLPANARVCPCKMNCSLSLVLGGKKESKQQIFHRLQWNENHYLPLHWFQLFFFDLTPLSLTTGNISEVFEFFNLSTYSQVCILSLSVSSWLFPIRISLRISGMLHTS